jgi:hypothetical protein
MGENGDAFEGKMGENGDAFDNPQSSNKFSPKPPLLCGSNTTEFDGSRKVISGQWEQGLESR